MGGSYYDREVESVESTPSPSPSTSSSSAPTPAPAAYSTKADEILSKNQCVHAQLNPLNRTLETKSTTPIVVAIDVTGSMGNWSKIIWDKMPMFFGQLMMQKYVTENTEISFCAVGDAYTDVGPLQVCNFAQGIALDDWLAKLWLEGAGGGQGKETYELAAYFYANRCTIPEGTKGFFFFTGDEDLYPFVSKQFFPQFVGGVNGTEDVATEAVFEALKEKFHVFHLHKPYPDRTKDRINIKSWDRLLGASNVLICEEAKAVVDVMLGAISITTKTRTLEDYERDLEGRGQSAQRIKNVKEALNGLNERINGKDKSSIKVKVVSTTGDFDVSIQRAALVRELKQLVEEETLIPVGKQKLTFENVELNDSLTLISYNLTENSKVELSQIMLAFGQGSNIKVINFSLNWGYPRTGQDYLDGSCLVYANDKHLFTLDYNHKNYAQALTHSGDVMTSTRGSHVIKVDIEKLGKDVTHLFFTLSSWNSPTIASFPNPTVVLSEASAPTEQLCEYSISKAAAHQAVVMCSLQRHEDGWVVHALGVPSKGNAKNYTPIMDTLKTVLQEKH